MDNHHIHLLLVALLFWSFSCASSAVQRERIQASPSSVDITAADSTKVEVMPQLLSIPRPTYTKVMRQAEAEGTVTVQALVGKDGRVQDAFVRDGGIVLLNDAALDAVRQARFEPARSDGEPIAVWVALPIRFVR
jgi:protein TonB